MKTFLLFLFFTTVIYAQEISSNAYNYQSKSPFSLDFSTGIFNKFRFRVEYRFRNNFSLSYSHANYYAANPGQQYFLEGKRYFNHNPKSELFVYAKIGQGVSTSYNGRYGVFGVGFGQRVYPTKKQSFFFQFNQGIKMCPTFSGDIEAPSGGFRGLFYLVGPGSIVDLNINIGWRF